LLGCEEASEADPFEKQHSVDDRQAYEQLERCLLPSHTLIDLLLVITPTARPNRIGASFGDGLKVNIRGIGG
jgi:hypothetical protein